MLVTQPAPTTAERIRTAVARADGAVLVVEGADACDTPLHHLLEDGSFAVTVTSGGPAHTAVSAAQASGVEAVLELADYAPLPLREPVRSLVWIGGIARTVDLADVPQTLDLIASENPDPALLRITSPPAGRGPLTLLRLEAASVVVADASGAEAIGVSSLLSARPDPFCFLEAGWIQHMEAQHPDVVERLAARLPARLRRGRVRLLSLNRYGVHLRVEAEDGDHDVRLPFARPVDDVASLSQALRVLVGCPFLNGLRARRG